MFISKVPACSTVCNLATLGWSAWHRLFFHLQLHQSGWKKKAIIYIYTYIYIFMYIHTYPYIYIDIHIHIHWHSWHVHISYIRCEYPSPNPLLTLPKPSYTQIFLTTFTKWTILPGGLVWPILMETSYYVGAEPKNAVQSEKFWRNRIDAEEVPTYNRVIPTVERGRIASLLKKQDKPWKRA